MCQLFWKPDNKLSNVHGTKPRATVCVPCCHATRPPTSTRFPPDPSPLRKFRFCSPHQLLFAPEVSLPDTVSLSCLRAAPRANFRFISSNKPAYVSPCSIWTICVLEILLTDDKKGARSFSDVSCYRLHRRVFDVIGGTIRSREMWKWVSCEHLFLCCLLFLSVA